MATGDVDRRSIEGEKDALMCLVVVDLLQYGLGESRVRYDMRARDILTGQDEIERKITVLKHKLVDWNGYH